jgi:hypothetical protein
VKKQALSPATFSYMKTLFAEVKPNEEEETEVDDGGSQLRRP